VQIINIQDIIRVPSIDEMKDMYVTYLFLVVIWMTFLVVCIWLFSVFISVLIILDAVFANLVEWCICVSGNREQNDFIIILMLKK